MLILFRTDHPSLYRSILYDSYYEKSPPGPGKERKRHQPVNQLPVLDSQDWLALSGKFKNDF